MEIWKDVKEFDGLYQISNKGRAKSLPRRIRNNKGFFISKEKILKPNPDKWGYLTYSFRKDGKTFVLKAHRIVATTFIKNKDNKATVNHINEIKTDNRVENLEWATMQENINHGTHNERVRKTLLNNKYKSKPVAQYTLGDSLVAVYPSTKEAERTIGRSFTGISNCARGKQKTAYGYKWKYIYN